MGRAREGPAQVLGYQGTYVQLATEGLHGGPGDSLFAKNAGGADGVRIRALLKKLEPKSGSAQWWTSRPPSYLHHGESGHEIADGASSHFSPSNSNTYRNDLLKMLQWNCDGRKLQLLATPEPNLMKVVTVGGPEDEEALVPGTWHSMWTTWPSWGGRRLVNPF